MDLTGVLEIAMRNNSEVEAYRLRAEAEQALIRTAFSIDKTSVYYFYDENNVAANNYPIGVFGGEQRFDFPTVYFAQKKANTLAYEMAVNQYMGKKKQLSGAVSKAYFGLVYFQKRHALYRELDSLYLHFLQAAQSSYAKGATSYLELLNAESKHNEVALLQSQMQQDIDIAYNHLRTLMNYDSVFVVTEESLQMLEIREDSVGYDPAYQYLQNAGLKQDAELKVQRQMLLPDVRLNYFNGTNRYEGAARYQGFEVGLGVPLFFGEQRARIKATQYNLEASASLQTHYALQYENRRAELKAGLNKYLAAIRNYQSAGKQLSDELVRSAQLSYSAGEIDFFRFAESMDRAVEIELNYLENLYQYNQRVLDINYLILEN
jgi:cobalt-zinc-cadmium resistance protein CzcA